MVVQRSTHGEVNDWRVLSFDSDWKGPFTETPEKREDLAFVRTVVVFVEKIIYKLYPGFSLHSFNKS